MNTRFIRRISPILAAAVLAGLGLCAASPAQADSVTIDTMNKTSVASAYRDIYLPALQVPIDWVGSTRTCDAGAPSAAGKNAIITVYNYMRAMAGMPSMPENLAESAATQQAALMLEANSSLSHYRSPSYACYTSEGARNYPASGGGEMLAPMGDASAIPAYMLDHGISNERMGHRASILAAYSDSIGVGSTTHYNAIHWAFSPVQKVDVNYFSWPNAGYFPYELIDQAATRWSFYPSNGDAAAAKVTVAKNGVALSIPRSYPALNAAAKYMSDTGLGWDMPAITQPAYGAVDTYRVKITGITGGSLTSATYDVLVFGAAPTVAVGPVSISGTGQVGSMLTASVASVSPSDAQVGFIWYRGDDEVGWGNVYQPTAADVGAELVVKATGVKAQWASGTAAARIGVPTLPMKQFTLGADMTGDGLGDVLAVDSKGDLWQYRGQASGTLGGPVRIGAGFGGYQVYDPGDMDNDGQADVLAISSDGKLWLFHGNGSSRLGSGRQVGWGWTGWRLIPVGDLNGDKKADLLGINGNGDLFMYAAKGDGSFEARVQVGSGWNGWTLYAASDLNGDGKNDILGINSKGDLYQYTGKGSGWFNPRVQAGSGWSNFTLASGADLTGDNLADILGRNNSTGTLYFYKGLGNARFATRVVIASGW